jgi:Tfp pilus assembly protein PilX
VPAISNRPVVQRRPSVSDERGMALIVALLSMMLLMALGISLTLTTTTETMVTSNYSSGVEAMYAADAGIERTMQDLLTVSDWNTVLASADGVTSNQMSGFTSSDMSPTLGDGRELDLLKATNMANCPHISPPSSTPCSTAQMNQYTEERPWTLNNPRWRLYAHGPVEDFVPTGTINSPFYIAVWVADDPSDNRRPEEAPTPARASSSSAPRPSARPARIASSKQPLPARTARRSSAGTRGSEDRTNRTAARARPPCRPPASS